MDTGSLHSLARSEASLYDDLDRKQLRFNNIVETAVRFYSCDPCAGVKELVLSSSRASTLYVPNDPMTEQLNLNYQWMLA